MGRVQARRRDLIAAALVALGFAACDFSSHPSQSASQSAPASAPGPAAAAPSGSAPAAAAPSARDAGPIALMPAQGEQPSAATAAFLGGLAPGATIAGWTVGGITGAPTTTIAIAVTQGSTRLTVWIAPKGADAHQAPRDTATHSIYFQGVPGEPTPAGLDPLLDELAARVKQHE